MSETKPLNIYQKLIEVRKVVPSLKKEAEGKQFKYNSSSQVLKSVREKMDELNLLLIPAVTDKRLHQSAIEYFDNEGRTSKRTITYFTELDMTMTWVNGENPEEKITVPWYAQGVDIAGEKGVGKALTYGEKYFILKQFNIATDNDDPDSHQGIPKNEESKLPVLKAKWQTLAGDLNEFDDFYKKQQEAGYNDNQIDTFLTKKLKDKKGA